MNTLYASLPERLLPWFSAHARALPWRQDKDPYHVWLSEIMLQQTRVEAVRGYYTRFLAAFPSIEALALAPLDKVLKLWEGLGYYSRAKNLQKAAQVIMEDFGGIFPSSHKEILSLPGIGPYTAGAISSICFDLPTPAVDGNVLRVIARYGKITEPIDLPQVKKEIQKELAAIYPKGSCGDFTQSLMELGATVCTPASPDCMACPLRETCRGRRAGMEKILPIRLPKKARRIEEMTVFFLTADDAVALRKRKNQGLLASLWELPNVQGTLSVNGAIKEAAAFGVLPKAPIRMVERVHVFTHVEWHMTCYYIPCTVKGGDFTWVQMDKLQKEIALPTAFRIFFSEEISKPRED